MCEGPIGKIFCGSYDGDVYVLSISRNSNTISSASGIISKVFEYIIGYIRSPVIGLITDSNFEEICYWTEDNSCYMIKYDYDSERFIKLGSISSIKQKIISASCAGDDYFEVFTQSGERYILNGKNISVIPPIQGFGSTVTFGASTMGCVVIISDKKATFIRTQRLNGKVFSGDTTVVSLPGTPVFLSFGLRPRATNNSDSLYWQHICLPPTAYILTTAGGIVANFMAPFEKVKRLSTLDPNDFAKNLDITDYNSDVVVEHLSSLVALCSFSPDLRSHYFYQATNLINKTDHLSFSSAILTRLTRLMTVIDGVAMLTEVPRFRKRKTKFVVNYDWKNLPAGFAIQLEDIASTIKDYIKSVENQTESFHFVGGKKNRVMEDYKMLSNISAFVNFVLEVVKTISTFARQKSTVLTHVIEYVRENDSKDDPKNIAIDFLTSQPIFDFSNPNFEPSEVSHYLCCFITAFFLVIDKDTRSNLLASRMAHNSTGFSYFIGIHISNILSQLQIAKLSEGAERTIAIREQLHSILSFIEFIDYPMIVNQFKDLNSPQIIYEIAFAKAQSIDPQSRALQWLMDGQPVDMFAEDIFNNVVEIFEIACEAYECDDGIESAITFCKKNKLFAMTFYHFLDEKDKLSELIKMDAPFIDEFVKTNHPELLYKVFIEKKLFLEAAEELYKLGTDKEADQQDKINWLNMAIAICSKYKLTSIEAKIQEKLNDEMASFLDDDK
ncbi:hypothetical protein TVAG_150240 [Trichomonas vaginalis G3]|uniref:Nucleoporin Nup133/Nup155-like C-terminal domain-containing protein n=1 Tax=Trichomonas vaginalis (strain ATCC PRA-98 / G3) TaxID=412133 RepID=A2DRS6_TRIV3|nr:nuclear pore complex protein NUP155 family [Trichomonas vaginalis G3]EAY16873.1 hypothetical protein TVAG_150240 [Trichomonas vaginalis G3]KAI5489140.1 nuclear pore complex protein NUP155 family [Trichomonas vaginalis G3]|eukprot:XP_001329096.1 hypothetical protein [Trichomonas vaginalis G3]